MMSVLLFLKNNPFVIALLLVFGIISGVFVYVNHLNKKIDVLTRRIVVLEADTLSKRNELLQLKSDTTEYLKSLRQIKMNTDRLSTNDKKQNPKLVDKFPELKDLKKK